MADEVETDENESFKDASVNITGYENFSSYIAEGFKVMMEGVKASNTLPAGRNYQFYQTYTNFRDKMREQVDSVHDVMEELLSSQGLREGVRNIMMEDALDTMLTMNDRMLDRATRCMDVMEGVRTGLSQLVEEVSGSWNRPKRKDKLTNFTLSIKKNVPRPQFTFRDKVDNSNTIWDPKIREKPNAIKPLAVLLEKTEDGVEFFSHPYEYELELFSVPDGQLKRVKNPTKPQPLEETPWLYVETEQQLSDMITYLDQQTAFAVDLEHHSYRSFMGFTCLIQISTQEKDFIVDSLALRHALHSLNQVFTKPSILKVLHGADSDVIWLQRDFSVYLVNMLDTHQAAKLLGYPKLSLAYLLNIFCGIDPNKHFQLFDWRTRPLPEAAVKYAREDTHYLLYIAEMMSNQLLEKAYGNTNILKAAYQQSGLVCKKRFEKLVIDEESYMNVYRKGKRFFDNRQLFAVKALYLWRDKTARELDESLAYVLPDNMMLNIAENLPREVQGILACCNPVPPLVKVNLLEIHYLIVKAKEQPLVKVVEEGSGAQVSTTKTLGVTGDQQLLEQWYHPATEFRDDLPTLLADNLPDEELDQEMDSNIKNQPHLSIFNNKIEWYVMSKEDSVELETEVLEKLQGLNFVSPYQRYVRVLPYAAQIEKERRDAEATEAEEHRLRSRQQQALAMEIRSLQESGLIKLKEDKEDIETLKFRLMNERKRKSEECVEKEVMSKKERRQNRKDKRNSGPQASRQLSDRQTDFQGKQSPSHDQPRPSDALQVGLEDIGAMKEESTVKEEADEEDCSASSTPPPPSHPPTSWKELRQQANLQSGRNRAGNVKPFDYSQVDFDKKFSSGNLGQKQAKSSPANKTNIKKRWKNNPGAQKFLKKSKKRKSVV